MLAFLSLILILVNALFFENHSKLVEGSFPPGHTTSSTDLILCVWKSVTGSQLPQLTSLLPSTRTSFHLPKGMKQQQTRIDAMLSNPFSLYPVAFSLALVFPSFFLPECVFTSASLSMKFTCLTAIKFVRLICSLRQLKLSSRSVWLSPPR